MSFLKIEKVIKVCGDKTNYPHLNYFGYTNAIYPVGTNRYVKRLTIKGYRKVKQICSHITCGISSSGVTVYYNIWKDVGIEDISVFRKRKIDKLNSIKNI